MDIAAHHFALHSVADLRSTYIPTIIKRGNIMKIPTRFGVLLALAACAFGAHLAYADQNCRSVHALIVDKSAPDNCTSPFLFCAAGTVEGNRGLDGTTYFVLDGAVGSPATAPGFGVTSGLLVYTTHHGTLTVRETGVSKLTGQPSNGFLSSIQEIVSGTGRFAGASGTLYNNALDVNSVFYSHISGKLCLLHQATDENSMQSDGDDEDGT
jgi:hypothetical protein